MGRDSCPGPHTPGMKVAISIPDDVFADAEHLAETLKKPRSQVYSDALREYVARHAPDRVTAPLDEVLATEASTPDGFARAAAEHTLRRSEW